MNRIGAATFVFLLACGSEERPVDPGEEAARVAGAICDAAATCACVAGFASDEECRHRYVERFEAAADRDMTVHRECVQDYVDALAEDPCLTEHVAYDFTCTSLRGSQKVWESCSEHSELPLFWAEECDEGLVCRVGTCWPADAGGGPTPLLQPGDPCWAESPLSCGSGDVTCGSDGVCHELGGIGADCEPFRCASSTDTGPLYCEGSYGGEIGTCAPVVALGQPCDPLDYKPCGNGQGDVFFTCDTSTRTCVEGTPQNLCWLMNFPTTWR